VIYRVHILTPELHRFCSDLLILVFVLTPYLQDVWSYTWFTEFLFLHMIYRMFVFTPALQNTCSYTWITECIYSHLYLKLINILHSLAPDLYCPCSVSLIYRVPICSTSDLQNIHCYTWFTGAFTNIWIDIKYYSNESIYTCF
jgi:hypothetical protein